MSPKVAAIGETHKCKLMLGMQSARHSCSRPGWYC